MVEEQVQAGKEAEAAAILARLSGMVDAALDRAPEGDAARFVIAPGLVAERCKQIETLSHEAEASSAAEIAKLKPALEEVIQNPDVLLFAIDAEIGKLLKALFVEPAMRGRGVGRALCGAALVQTAGLGCGLRCTYTPMRRRVSTAAWVGLR